MNATAAPTGDGTAPADMNAFRARLYTAVRRLPPDSWALLAIALAVVLANLPYLLDFVDPNPLGPASGLVTGLTPGRLPGAATIDPNNGLISQALGHRAMLDWFHLQIPWWNPYEGTGAPLAGEMQSAALFPPTILTLLANGQLYEHLLLELLAGISTYLLLRRLLVGRTAGTAAGIAFALNGTFSWFAHATVNPVAFLPLLLLGIEAAYAASLDRRRGGWWLIAVAGALSFYAGFPEVAYIDSLMAAGWFAWRFGCLPRDRRRALAGKAAAGAVVGTLLAAPLLIASIDYLNHGDVGFHASTALASGHLPSQALPQLLLPYVYGPIVSFEDPKLILLRIWFNVGGYVSTSLLLFALLGVFSKRRRGLRLGLLVWIVLVMARMYGQPPLLGHVLGLLPGMSQVFFFRYAFAPLELSIVLLAAFGIDDLARASVPRRRWRWIALASLAVVAVAAFGAAPLARAAKALFSHPYYPAAVVWGAGIVIAGGAAAVMVRNRRARGWLMALLVAADAIVLFVIPGLSAPRAVSFDQAPITFLQQHAETGRFVTLGPLAPNYGSYFGIGSISAEDVPLPSAFTRYARTRLDQTADPVGLYSPTSKPELMRNLQGYRAAGVTYVLTSAGQTLPQSPATFTLVSRSPSTWIYRLAGSEPYFSVSDPRCSISFRSRTSVRLACPRAATLIRRETYLPGWSAAVDNHPATPRRVDGLFQAVTVGPGLHRVTFSYRPPNVGWGVAALVVGCAWLLVGVVGLSRTARQRT